MLVSTGFIKQSVGNKAIICNKGQIEVLLKKGDLSTENSRSGGLELVV